MADYKNLGKNEEFKKLFAIEYSQLLDDYPLFLEAHNQLREFHDLGANDILGEIDSMEVYNRPLERAEVRGTDTID